MPASRLAELAAITNSPGGVDGHPTAWSRRSARAGWVWSGRRSTPRSTARWRSRCYRKNSRGDPERLGRFQREAKAVAASDHPNIVTVHVIPLRRPKASTSSPWSTGAGQIPHRVDPQERPAARTSSSTWRPPPWPMPSARHTSKGSRTATSSPTTS